MYLFHLKLSLFHYLLWIAEGGRVNRVTWVTTVFIVIKVIGWRLKNKTSRVTRAPPGDQANHCDRVTRATGVNRVTRVTGVNRMTRVRYPSSYVEYLSHQDFKKVSHVRCFNHFVCVFFFVIVIVFVIMSVLVCMFLFHFSYRSYYLECLYYVQ